jgi:hypothetical protein
MTALDQAFIKAYRRHDAGSRATWLTAQPVLPTESPSVPMEPRGLQLAPRDDRSADEEAADQAAGRGGVLG